MIRKVECLLYPLWYISTGFLFLELVMTPLDAWNRRLHCAIISARSLLGKSLSVPRRNRLTLFSTPDPLTSGSPFMAVQIVEPINSSRARCPHHMQLQATLLKYYILEAQ